MLLSIEYRGQLALAATSPRTTCEVKPGTQVADVLRTLAEPESDQFRELALSADGRCGTTLFVAIDGEHMRLGAGAVVPEGAKEMIVMPPIAGG